MPRQIAEHEYCAFDPSGRAIAEKRREDSARPLGALAARMAQRRVLHKAARDVALAPAAHVVTRSLPDQHSTCGMLRSAEECGLWHTLVKMSVQCVEKSITVVRRGLPIYSHMSLWM